MSEPILVEIDSREPTTFYHEFLSEFDRKDPKTRKMLFTVERKMLPLGDFIFNKRIAVERKEARDFLQSIKDKRIFKQVSTLVKTYGKENVYLLIEGDPIEYAFSWSSGFAINSIIGVQRWCMQQGICYCERSSRRGVILFLKNLAKYSLKDEVAKKPTPVINKPKFTDVTASQLALMQIIPEIGYSTSRKILLEHGSPIEFFHAIINDELDVSTESRKKRVELWKHILTDKFIGEKE